MRNHRAPRTVLGVLAAASLTLPASADVTCADWIDGTDYCYTIAHMPDLDQKRAGLPNDGKMYCVPTAAMNMIAYIANHGFDEVPPGPGNWMAPGNYDTATAAVGFMGLPPYMDTDPSGGTSGSGWLAGMETWLGPYDKFTWTYQYASGNFAPSQALITGVGITGGLVQYIYGRYLILGSQNGLLLLRQGGHSVTLSHSERHGGPGVLWCRDPGDDSDLDSQSTFANKLHSVDAVTVNFANGAPWATRIMERLNWPSGDGRPRLLDSFGAVRPKYGYTFTDTGVETFTPFSFGGDLVQEIPVQQSGPLLDVLADADGIGFVALFGPEGQAPASYAAVSALTREASPPVTVPGALGMTIAWNRSAYVLYPTRLERHDLDDDSAVVDAVGLRSEVKALAYSSLTNEIAMISAADRLLIFADAADLSRRLRVYVCPSDADWLDGDLWLAAHPRRDAVWVSSKGSDVLYELTPDEDGTAHVARLGDPSLAAPRGIDFDDRGNLFVSDGGAVLQFAQACDDCPWLPVEDPFLEGFEVGDVVHVSRSSTNFDPEQHDGPGWENIDPDELEVDPVVPDCFGDTNGDGVVDFEDLLGVLSNWGTDDWQHDIAPDGGDGVVDFDDLLAILGAWGPCP